MCIAQDNVGDFHQSGHKSSTYFSEQLWSITEAAQLSHSRTFSTVPTVVYSINALKNEFLSGWSLTRIATSGPPNAYRQPLPVLHLPEPCAVQTALIAEGFLAPLTQPSAELGAEWVLEDAWVYGRPLPPAGHDRWLRYRGYGPHTVTLGKTVLASDVETTEPISLCIPARMGGELSLHFHAIRPLALARRSAYFGEERLPENTPCFDERSFVVHPPYLWGWDWGPFMPMVGIVSEVELFHTPPSYPKIVQQHKAGEVRLEISGCAVAHLISPEGETLQPIQPGVWEIEDPQLWWPQGSGAKSLYRLAGTPYSVGLRQIKLLQEPDQHGQRFAFEVNGQPLWIAGANWTPMTLDPSQTPAESIRARVQRLSECGMNMLRIWGGQPGEGDAFYDACDEFGILVWQDFLAACSYLPDSPPWCERWQDNAQSLHDRLAWRTCLALWCGNNEVHQMHQQRWAGAGTPARFHGEHVFTETFKTIAEPDYVETSPLDIGATGHGDRHFWEVWHGKGDWEGVEAPTVRFASEFGFASLATCASAEDLFGHHNKTGRSAEVIRDLIRMHYDPKTPLDWVVTSQLNQRDALRHLIEQWHLDPACEGVLVWQANDCWPALSWSLIDFAGNEKPALQDFARLALPGAIVQRKEDFILSANKEHSVERTHFGPDGAILNQRQWVAQPGELLYRTDATFTRLRIDQDPRTDRWSLPCKPKDLNLPEPVFSLEGNRLTLEKGLALDLLLQGNRTPVVSLSPGESVLCAPPLPETAWCLGCRPLKLGPVT